MRKNKVRVSRIIILVLAILGLVYFAGVWYFKDRFSPNTYVDGFKVGTKTIQKVEEIVKSQADHYVLEMKTIDHRDQMVRASDIDLSFELRDIVKEMKVEQGSFSWPLDIFNKTEYHAVPEIKINEDKLETYLFSLPIFSKDAVVKPENARIELMDNKFVVVDEIEGNVIKKKKFLAAVKEHIYNNETFMDINEEGYYKKPKIYSDDKKITVPMDTLNKYNNSVINYEIEGHNEVVDPSVFSAWVDIDLKKKKVSINRDKVAEYVQNMARKYDTWSSSREFKTTGAGTITIKGGTYGWLIERKAEVDRLIKDIESGQEISREPIYRYKAKSRTPNDIGKTYVEIDISRQRMWFYKDGKLIVETPVVTGRPTPSRYTPVGVYPLNYKTKDATLSGQGYSSKVKLWMPFNNNIGIHDASWRSNFGGEIYKSRGSHGCINTPYAAVQKIYPLLEKGDPIVVYTSRAYIIREPVAPKPEKKEDEKKEDDKKKEEKKKEKPTKPENTNETTESDETEE